MPILKVADKLVLSISMQNFRSGIARNFSSAQSRKLCFEMLTQSIDNLVEKMIDSACGDKIVRMNEVSTFVS